MRILHFISLLSGFGLLVANGFFGREFFGPRKRSELPSSIRQTPGAYRNYLINHGFHGGK